MLVLKRCVGESIDIGPTIRVTITKRKGKQICVGIEAPDHYDINRSELGVEPRDDAIKELIEAAREVCTKTIPLTGHEAWNQLRFALFKLET